MILARLMFITALFPALSVLGHMPKNNTEKGNETMSETVSSITIEECFRRCIELRDEVNAAIRDEQQDVAKAKATALKKAIDEYNKMWKDHQFDEFLGTDMPVLTAIKRLFIYKLTASVKTNKDTGELVSASINTNVPLDGLEDAKTVKLSIKDNIDLAEFEDYAKRRVFNHGQWRYWVENFAFLMGARACEKIGKTEAADRYRRKVKMSAEAREAGRAVDGNANAVATLQEIVDAIVFIDSGKTSKVTTNDLEYIRALMCSETAGIDVSLPNAKVMRRLVCKAIHKHVTGKEYGFIYEESDEVADDDLPEIPGATKAEARILMTE